MSVGVGFNRRRGSDAMRRLDACIAPFVSRSCNGKIYQESTSCMLNSGYMEPKINFLIQVLYMVNTDLETVKNDCFDRNHSDLVFNHSHLHIFGGYDE